MVLVGYVIEKDEKAFSYFARFVQVFKGVKAHPFSKKKLFNSFDYKIKVFGDRMVFVFSGSITAFSFVRYLLWYALITILLVFVFLGGVLSPLLRDVMFLLFGISVCVMGVFYVLDSATYWWGSTERSMNKKKFGLKGFKKRLLSSKELVDCFVWDNKPLFKKEVRVLEN